MNKILYFLMLKTAFSSSTLPIIRYLKYPICCNCVHFLEHKTYYPYDPPPDSKEYGKCKLFGQIDLITGDIEYDYAKKCRSDNTKCGKNGTNFEEIPKK